MSDTDDDGTVESVSGLFGGLVPEDPEEPQSKEKDESSDSDIQGGDEEAEDEDNVEDAIEDEEFIIAESDTQSTSDLITVTADTTGVTTNVTVVNGKAVTTKVSAGNKFYIIKPEDRKTSPLITKLELAAVIGMRAQHIDSGAHIFVNHSDLNNPEAITLREIYEKSCPLSIMRNMGNNKYELWSVNEMVLPQGFKNNNPI